MAVEFFHVGRLGARGRRGFSPASPSRCRAVRYRACRALSGPDCRPRHWPIRPLISGRCGWKTPPSSRRALRVPGSTTPASCTSRCRRLPEAHDLAVGAGHRRPRRQRQPQPDRPAHVAEPVMRGPRTWSAQRSRGPWSPPRRRRSRSPAIAPRARPRAASDVIAPVPGPAGLSLITGAGVPRRADRLGRASNAADQILIGSRQHMAFATRRRQHARFIRVCKERYRHLRADQDNMPQPGQHLGRLVDDIEHPLDPKPVRARAASARSSPARSVARRSSRRCGRRG